MVGKALLGGHFELSLSHALPSITHGIASSVVWLQVARGSLKANPPLQAAP